MKYSHTAITQLSRWYKQVLLKCSFINALVLIGGIALVPNVANADGYTTRQVTSSNPTTFDDDYFHDSNQTGERGGSIYNTSGNTLNLIRDAFYKNSADWGGAVYSAGTAPLNIYGGTTFNNNIARYEGGAVYSASNVTISGHDGTNTYDSTGVSFSGNKADGIFNDIYMGGSSNTALTLALNSQVHTYEWYDSGWHYNYHVDDIALEGGIDGEYYKINVTSQTNSAGTSTVAMGNVNGATTINIGANGSSTFGVATADEINAGDLNMYNNSQLTVAGDATFTDDNYDYENIGDVNVSSGSELNVGGSLTASDDINNEGTINVTSDIIISDTITNNSGNITAGDTNDADSSSDILAFAVNNTNGSIQATGDIYQSYDEEVEEVIALDSLSNLRESDALSEVDAEVLADNIYADTLNNAISGDSIGTASIIARNNIITENLSNSNTASEAMAIIAAGSLNTEGKISAKETITNNNGIIIAHGDIFAGTSLTNTDGSVSAFSYTDDSGDTPVTFDSDIDTITLKNTDGSIQATGDIYALNDAEEGTPGSITNKKTTADDIDATVKAGGDIITTTLLNEKTETATGDGTAEIIAGKANAEGNIIVEDTLTNNKGTITAYGDISADTSLINTAGSVSAFGYIDETGDEPEVVDGNIDTVMLGNNNGSILATGDITALDEEGTTGVILNYRMSDDDVDSTIYAGGDIVTKTLTNGVSGAGDGTATISAGGDMYASAVTEGEGPEATTNYTGLTLVNAEGDIDVAGNIYVVAGDNSGTITAGDDGSKIYFQGSDDEDTPNEYNNSGIIHKTVDVAEGMILNTDGVTYSDEETPQLLSGITSTIHNDGILNVKSGKIVDTVDGAGTFVVASGNETTIDDNVSVEQNIVETGATGKLNNNGTLTINELLDNEGEIANDHFVILNGIGEQENEGVISGDGILYVNTGEDETGTDLLNSGLINNTIYVSEESSLETAGADTNNAATAENGITGKVFNDGYLEITDAGTYLLDDISNGEEGSGMTSITGTVTALSGVGITQDIIDIAGDASLTIDADKITATTIANNDGALELNGGDTVDNTKTLEQDIYGEGLTVTNGYIEADSLIDQELWNDGALTINADNLGGYVTNDEDSVLTLTGGTLAQDINSDGEARNGSVVIDGDVAMDSSSVYADSLSVEDGATLTVGSNVIEADEATITGTLDIDITAAEKGGDSFIGSNVTIGDLTATDGTLVVNIADDVLDAQHAESQEIKLIQGADATFGTIDVTNSSYTITADEEGNYVIRNEDSYADTGAAASGSQSDMNAAVGIDNAMGLAKGTAGREMQKKLNLLSKSSPIAYQKALTDIAPTNSAVHTGLTQDFNNMIDAQLADRMSEGMNSGDTFESKGAWVQALYNHSKQDSSRQTPGFKGHTSGLALGLDGKLNSQTTVGVGYAYGKSDVDSAGRETDIKSHNLMVYGKYKPSQWFVRGMANYGTAKYEETAHVLGLVNKGDYDVDNYGIRAYIGYDLPNGFTPEAGLRYTHIENDGYTDTFSQHVKANDNDVLTAVVGATYAHTFDNETYTITPKAHLAATYDLMSDDSEAVVRIGSSVYNVTGDKLDRFGIEVGASADLDIGDWTLSAGYDLGLRNDYTSHTGMLKAKYSF